MKTLYLLRHGKSDWDADYDGDHERPLAPRGEKAARKVGKFLRKKDNVPELVLSSTAVRARTTFEIAMDAGSWDCEWRLREDLYGASLQTILYVLGETPKSVDSLMLVGHEPTWSGSIRMLTGANARFPTACLCRIDFATNDWQKIRQGTGELQWLVPPKIL